MPILQIRKLRLREVKELDLGLPARGCKLGFEAGGANFNNCTGCCVSAAVSVLLLGCSVGSVTATTRR